MNKQKKDEINSQILRTKIMKLIVNYKKEDGALGQIDIVLEGFELFEKDLSSEQTQEKDDVLVTASFANDRIKCSVRTKETIRLEKAVLECMYSYHETDRIFVNGYQSWTETKEYRCTESIHNMDKVPSFMKKKYHFENYGEPWFYQYKNDVIHGFTYSYIVSSESCRLIGSLNEELAYLIIAHHPKTSQLVLESDCGGRQVKGEFTLFDFVIYEGGQSEVQKKYFENFGSCDVPAIRGYTSWYKHYQDIDRQKVIDALDGIDANNYDVFQIDDGFETFVGDWFDIDKQKFPEGLKPLVDKIHAKGLKAGIWLAPFVAEQKSRLFKEHPDWILCREGNPVFAGCNWSGDVALDLRKPEVQNYVKAVLHFYMDMGFDLFKLDFLYAAALCAGDSLILGPDETGNQTRAEIMRASMMLLRETLKDKLILGCGVPLSSAFNLVEYCRIGPDISLSFDDVFYMRKMHRERVSTKVTLQNTIFRAPMDGTVFRCDPDVYLLRDDKIKLSNAQKEAVAMLNHLCGAVYFTSDNVATYDDNKKQLLNEAQKLAGAAIRSVERDGEKIIIEYMPITPGNTTQTIIYDTTKGVLIHG